VDSKAASSELRVRVLGSVAVRVDDSWVELVGSMAEALTVLVLAGSGGVTSSEAADAFWGTDRDPSTTSSVRTRFTRLRSVLGDGLLGRSAGGYRLDVTPSEVDRWLLERSASSPDLPNAPLLTSLLRGELRRWGRGGDLLDREERRIAVERCQLIGRISTERPDLLTPAMLQCCVELHEHDPFDEQLLQAVVDAHLAAGARRDARALLHDAQQFLDRELPGSAVALRAEYATLLDDGPLEAAPADRAGSIRLPSLLRRQLDNRIVGRDNEVQAIFAGIDSGGVAMVIGEAGSGKTRLLAETAALLDARGCAVTYLMGVEHARSSYGPFTAALPAFASALEDLLASPDDLTARARCWSSAVSIVREQSSGRPPVVIVDDAQWLDSSSAMLVDHLVRAASQSGISVILASRSESHGHEWMQLRSAMQRYGVAAIDVPPLDDDALEELVGELQPVSPASLRRAFAAELVTLTGGLPAIAHLVIEHADPVTLRRRTVGASGALDAHLGNLSRNARSVGAAAAVLGDRFTLADLDRLLDGDDADVAAALDELFDERLVRDDEHDLLTFRHVLVRDAFLGLLPAHRSRRLHLRAASSAIDQHHRARHLHRSLPLVDEDDVIEALLTSATAHYASGGYREAAEDLHRAEELSAGELAPEVLALHAAAIDRSGGDGHRFRRRAFDAYRSVGNWSGALGAALSGLPESEAFSGDAERVGLLTAIDPDALAVDERFDHAMALARQLELLGRAGSAMKWARIGSQLADTPERCADAAALQRLVSYGTTGPAERIRLLGDSGAAADPPRRAELEQLRAIDLLSIGDTAAAERANGEASELLADRVDPILQWRRYLIGSTIAWSRGDSVAADDLSNQAFRFGHRFGLRDATAAWMAHQWSGAWALDAHGALAAAMDHAAPDVSGSLLARVAACVSSHRAAADSEERAAAGAAAARLAQEAMEVPAYQSVAVAHLLAAVIDHSDRTLVGELTALLAPQSGSFLVFGAGVANLGPVDLALGDLAQGAERDDHYRRALDLADTADCPTWRSAIRVQLARRTGEAGLVSDARRPHRPVATL
jgi:DNA-binding SARP family transcriptional activator/type II secretory pathway predicted ATPase ExeA